MMKHLLLLAGLCAALSLRAADVAPSTQTFPPFTLGNTQVRPLPRSANGRDYLLYVALPASYAASPQRRYPVVYMTDGYWSFTLLNGLSGSLVYDRVVPEFIIVGLGYSGENLDYGRLRQWELSPVQFPDNPDSGHAAEFLTALEQEIIPLVEREYRGDPAHRVLGGGSLGGAFVLHTLFTKPELFGGYIAVSPAVGLKRNWFFDYEAAFARSGRPLKARLFMTGGGYEWPDFLGEIQRFNEQLTRRAYPDLAYQFRLIESERHGATNAEAVNRGLRFVFEPLAPETGIQRN